MRIFASAWFRRFAKRERISSAVLREAVERANRGHIDADLGGGVIKQRISRTGEGRSSGYRTIVLFRSRSLAVFIYGFAKRERSNIDANELRQFKAAAKHVLALSEQQLAALQERGDFWEIDAK